MPSVSIDTARLDALFSRHDRYNARGFAIGVDGGLERDVFGPRIEGEGTFISTIDDMLSLIAHMDRPTIGSARTRVQELEPLPLDYPSPLRTRRLHFGRVG